MLDLFQACHELLARGTKPTVPEVRPLVQAYYAKPNNGAGGALHVVLDDGNVSDVFVSGCVETARAWDDPDGEALAQVLLLMSTTQRRKLQGGR